ncbi:MAG TPA: dockerin type I domain-containing protein, partial [Chthoniobacterales bacterium]
NELASVGTISTSCGTVESSMIDPTDAHRFIVNLRQVTCNAEDVTVTLNNVTDTQSNTLSAVDTVMGLLLGDVDGDGSVTNADFTIEKADQGQTANSTNFRADIDASGTIDRRDATTVKQHIGTSL